MCNNDILRARLLDIIYLFFFLFSPHRNQGERGAKVCNNDILPARDYLALFIFFFFFFLHTEIKEREAQAEVVRLLLTLLPPANRDTLWALLRFLATVHRHSGDTTLRDGTEVMIMIITMIIIIILIFFKFIFINDNLK